MVMVTVSVMVMVTVRVNASVTVRMILDMLGGKGDWYTIVPKFRG